MFWTAFIFLRVYRATAKHEFYRKIVFFSLSLSFLFHFNTMNTVSNCIVQFYITFKPLINQYMVVRQIEFSFSNAHKMSVYERMHMLHS